MAKAKTKTQIEKFRNKARELSCDDDKSAFEAKLKQIAKTKRAESKPKHQASKPR